MPSTITYKADNISTSGYNENSEDSGCWTALRANAYVLPDNIGQLNSGFNGDTLGNSTTYRNVEVAYDLACEPFRSKVDVATALAEEKGNPDPGLITYQIGNCTSEKIACSLGDPLPKQC